MQISGIFLKANQVRIVTLSGTAAKHKRIAEKFNKIDLPKNPSQEDVEVFRQAFDAYCVTNSIDKVLINRRAISGQGAGGPQTFISEGVLLAISKAPIEFIHSATIRATEKKHSALKSDRPQTVDLGKSYDIAFQGLL